VKVGDQPAALSEKVAELEEEITRLKNELQNERTARAERVMAAEANSLMDDSAPKAMSGEGILALDRFARVLFCCK
jgi:hypothetical protein